jgi:insulysin
MFDTSKVELQIPQCDEREYRLIKLENELQVLLISDQTADKAAAALDVRVGHFQDPEDIPGLAHFCEHMLFLGTEKYPQEGSYQEFVKKAGGSTNAYTDMESTNYFFDITPDNLEECLDRFAQFFISPLFTEDASARELKAVHSEHQKNLQEDTWRQFQFLKSSANPAHPFHKFGTGNLYTLDTMPKENGLNIRSELLKFYNRYYSANIMRLVVLGKNSLDELESWVKPKFSPIVNKNLKKNKYDVLPYTPTQLGKLYKIVCVRDLRELSLVFPIIIDDEENFYLTKPDHYWSHLLGHESEGSIFSHLKKLGWLNSLSAGQTCRFTNGLVFTVVCNMTEEGEEHVHEIISTIFDYLQAMRKRGVCKWIFDECADLAQVQFRFLEKGSPSDYCSGLAVNMQKYRPEHIVSGGRLLFEYNEDRIRQTLNYLVPTNMNIVISSQQFTSIADKKERWYETLYHEEAIPSNWIAEFSTEKEIPAYLHLPIPNPFIQQNLDLKPAPENQSIYPVIILENEHLSLWFKQDITFKRPRVNMFYHVIVPSTYSSPHNIIMARLFTLLVSDSLNEYSYYGDLAGVSYDIQPSVTGFNVYLSGYNDKIAVLNHKVFERVLKTLELKRDRFELLREQLYRTFKNMRKDQPYQHAVAESMHLFYQFKYTYDEYAHVVQEITFEHLSSFIPVWLSCCKLQALYHGNMTKEEALMIIKETEKFFFDDNDHLKRLVPLPSQDPEERVVAYECGIDYIRQAKEPNEENANSAIEIIHQGGLRSSRTDALLDLMSQVISNPYYNQLRTIEQIGYIVFSRTRADHNTASFSLILQSSEKSPVYMLERSDIFMRSFHETLKNMEEEEIKQHITSLIAKKLEKDKQLKHETLRYWSELIQNQYCFDRRERQVAILEKLTKRDLVQFFEDFVLEEGKKRCRIIIEIFATPHQQEMGHKKNDATYIDDVLRFKRTLGLYPAHVEYV